MVSSPIINTLLFTIGFLLFINLIQASPIHNDYSPNDEDFDDTSYFDRRTLSNSDIPDGYVGIMLGKRRLEARGARLPTEAILLGKRRLPYEPVLLGKRDLPNEAVVLGKRRLPPEAVLLGKRDLPAETVILGKRDLPGEAVLLGKRDLPGEAVLLGK